MEDRIGEMIRMKKTQVMEEKQSDCIALRKAKIVCNFGLSDCNKIVSKKL